MMTFDPVQILSRSDVARLLTMRECITAVEGAFRALGQGAALPGVLAVHSGDGEFHIKAGILDSPRNYFAAKVNGNFPLNPNSWAPHYSGGHRAVRRAEREVSGGNGLHGNYSNANRGCHSDCGEAFGTA